MNGGEKTKTMIISLFSINMKKTSDETNTDCL